MLRIWLSVVFLFLGFSFLPEAQATEPVSCNVIGRGLISIQPDPGAGIGLVYPNYYTDCIEPIGVVWSRARNDNGYPSTNYSNFGQKYKTLQQAIDAVTPQIIEEMGIQLDYKNNGCPGCGLLTQEVFNQYFNTDSVCLGITQINPSNNAPLPSRPKNWCSPSQYRSFSEYGPTSSYFSTFSVLTNQSSPDTSDPSLYQSVFLGVYNPDPTLQGYSYGQPVYGYRAYGGPRDNSNLTGFVLVTEAVCPTGYENATGKDANDHYIMTCVLRGGREFQTSTTGLDSTIEGCAFGCNPVNLATGAKMDYAEDFRNQSSYPIVWDRYYSSFSGQWTFGYERNLTVWTRGSTSLKQAILKRPDGSLVKFKQTMSGWEADTPNNKGIITTFAPVMNSGLLTGYRYTNLKDEVELYDVDGRLVSLTSQEGWKLTFSYSGRGDLIKVQDDFGRHLDVQRSAIQSNGATWIEGITDGETTVLYDQSPSVGRNSKENQFLLNAVSHADGTTTEYKYDEGLDTNDQGSGYLTGIIDQSETRYASYTYNPGGQVTSSVHDPNGTPKEQVSYNYLPNYSPNQLENIPQGPATQISWNGGSSIASRAASNQGIPKINGFGSPCLYCAGADQSNMTYDAKGNPTTITNYKGVVSELIYDTNRGLVTQIKEAVGTPEETQVNLTWHPNFRVPTSTVEHLTIDGVAQTKTTTMSYNAQGQITERKVSVSTGEADRIWTYVYTNSGLLQKTISPLGRENTLTYDGQGNLLTQTNALGHTTTYGQYTIDGLAQLITDPNGLQTKLTYDDAKRLVKIEKGSTSTHWETVQYTYNALGLVTRIDFPNDDYLTMVYDANRQLVQVSNLLSERNITRNSLNQVTQESVKDLVNNTITQVQNFNYDALGRMNRKYNSGQTDVAYSYDSESQVTKVKDQFLNTEINYGYDGLNQLVSTTNELSQVFTLQHNQNRQTVSATDSRSNATTYDYNAFGEQVALHSPDSGETTYQFNKEGEVVLEINERLVQKQITYDALGRVTDILYNDETNSEEDEHLNGVYWGNILQSFTYDSCPNGVGKLCQMVDDGGTTTYSYDLWGRLIAKNWNPLGENFNLDVQYHYDNQGQAVGITYPSGQSLTQIHANSEIKELRWGARTILKDATYEPFHGAVRGWNWGGYLGGIQMTYTLDGQMNTLNIHNFTDRSYLYSGINRLSVIDFTTGGDPEGYYDYDFSGQLLTADLPLMDTLHFEYDANGNRLTKKTSYLNATNFQTDYVYDTQSNRVLSSEITLPVTNYARTIGYDGLGNIYFWRDQVFLYNAAGRMTYTRNYTQGRRAYFYYNGLGQRVLKERTVGTIGKDYFVYDEEGRILGVYDENGDVREELVWLAGHRPVATIRDNNGIETIYRIQTDHLGAPSVIFNEAGMPVWSWISHDPHGFTTPNEDHDGDNVSFTFNVRFPGQWYDVESGLFQNGFRDYSPELGRYMEPDPIGLAGGWNPYAYVGNNPVNFTDPSGLIINAENDKNGSVAMSLQYLKQSQTAKYYIEQMENDSHVYNVKVKNTLTNLGQFIKGNVLSGSYYDDSEKRIYWDEKNGRRLSSTCGYNRTPPALSLLHELMHALEDKEKPFFYYFNSSMKNDYFYTTPEEKRAMGIENQVAKELNLPQRYTHQGKDHNYYPIETKNPISVERKK